MSFRKTVTFSDEAYSKMKAIAEKRGISETRAMEVALDWTFRCDRATARVAKDAEIVAFQVEDLEQATQQTVLVV